MNGVLMLMNFSGDLTNLLQVGNAENGLWKGTYVQL